MIKKMKQIHNTDREILLTGKKGGKVNNHHTLLSSSVFFRKEDRLIALFVRDIDALGEEIGGISVVDVGTPSKAIDVEVPILSVISLLMLLLILLFMLLVVLPPTPAGVTPMLLENSACDVKSSGVTLKLAGSDAVNWPARERGRKGCSGGVDGQLGDVAETDALNGV